MTTPTPTRTSNSNSNNNNTNTPATPHLTTPYRNRTPPGSRYSSTTQPYAMLPVYQTATPHSPPFFKDNRKKSKHGTITSQWSDRYTFSDTTTLLRDDLRLTDSAIDRLVENMRRWISTQILEPLVYSIDAVDAELEDRNWCHLTCANYDSLHNAAEALTAAATVASANVGSGIGSGNTGNTMGFASAPASGFGLSAPGSSFLGGGFGSGGTTTGPTGFGTSSASTAPSFGGLASRLGPTNANPDPPTTTTMGGFGGFGSSLGQSIPTNNQPQTPQNLADLSQTYAQDPLSKIRLKLEVYLALPNCPSRAYLLNRIRALARGGVLGAYRWDSGIRDWFTTGRLGFGGSGNEGSGLLGSGGVGGSSGINSNIGSGGSGLGSHNTSEFDANPTDTQILFHLVCTYLDLITPGASLEANGGRPFSFRHILHCDATPSTDPCETEAPLVIKQETLVPPYFVLLINPARPGRPAFTCIEESAGRPHRDHLFQILGGFFLLARREFSGYLGLLHVDAHHFGMDLILSGLNAEALEIDHNPLT
ncbi:hypothetical protein BJ085DRAFT_31352 [Dimargaris cristalligena]|uniref:Uncharacterized protein n=1 Tax=Dimargaris cristalligena TaxID=215637 RepID=A0A4P9ZNA7_9FUNG|nr:hypothetical protein BJ085DRAFT_31352 [Dimargaris cristalligena]|eukprot:RKP34645.1 hypothetical protein BJ085DRAFT_31352 [Dimargaris cristalligena]